MYDFHNVLMLKGFLNEVHKMKKNRLMKMSMAICFLAGMLLFQTDQLSAYAAEVIATVNGTIMAETAKDLMYLSTNEGVMQIKLDSGTDVSGCKVLIAEQKVAVSVSSGTDGYLHAVKITSIAQSSAVSVDGSGTASVTGQLSKKSQGDIIYFNTSAGVMQIKLDASTDMSGCSMLVPERYYRIVCARGSDAYMHAVSISDSSASASTTTSVSSSSVTPAPADASAVKAATAAVLGTVTSNTKESLLYLSTSGGEMQFVIENNSDTRYGMVMTPGNTVTVSYYHGTDGYLHAVCVVGVRGAESGAVIDTSSPATVTGTVKKESNEDILYLDIGQGTMELKLDAVSSVSGCKIFVSGKQLTVTCARGSDNYMHALTIKG